MTLLMNVPEVGSETTNSNVNVEEKTSADELTLKIETENVQNSPMSEDQKAAKQASAPSLYSLFQKTLESKGEYPLEGSEWTGDKELKVDGLSSMTLHSFILEAESLGKKITYSKSLKIKISD